MNNHSRLHDFPISFFSVVMGLTGLTIAWEKAETTFALPFRPSPWLLAGSVLIFIILALMYAVKWLRYPQAVAAELRHPIRLSFFPTISISLILLAIATQHGFPEVSRILWITGSAAQLGFTLYVLGEWINQTHFEIHHLNPAWFIPVVGNLLVPVVGVTWAPADISWFFFSFGLLFWVIMLAIMFYRIIFHHPLPERLVPTLFILLAPPAVGFIAYFRLTGTLDTLGRLLFYSALFFLLLLFTQIAKFSRLRFFLSWWAYSFPLAAMTVATLLMSTQSDWMAYKVLGAVLLAIVSLTVFTLALRTGVAIWRREICVEEG